ncbi:unnamed protein product [Calypogeia fissa]
MTRGKADELKRWIQQDTFWVEVKVTITFFTPLVMLLREFDGDSPQSAWLYWSLKRGKTNLQASMEECPLVTEFLKPRILKVYTDRRKSLITDFMLAAAYINPHIFFDEDQDVAGDAELSQGFNEYVTRYAEHKVKEGIDHDRDVTALISTIQKQAFDAHQKLPFTSVSIRGAQSNMDKFSQGEWWHAYGVDYKDLRIMARKILHQKMCASSCERNWSSYGFIHSKSRNRLTNDRAKDLMFVFTNMRVEKGLTKVRNPHTSINKRYEESRARNDGPRPLSTEPIKNKNFDAARAFLGEEDVEDIDTIDDADEALQGLSLDHHNEFLTRIPPDTDISDADDLENELDLVMYPTIDESQIQDDQDASLDIDFVMSSQPSSSRTYPGLDIRNNVEASRSDFLQQRNGLQGHHSEGSRAVFDHQHYNVQSRSSPNTHAQWQQHAIPRSNVYVGPSATNPYSETFRLDEWNRLLQDDPNNTRNFYSQS